MLELAEREGVAVAGDDFKSGDHCSVMCFLRMDVIDVVHVLP